MAACTSFKRRWAPDQRIGQKHRTLKAAHLLSIQRLFCYQNIMKPTSGRPAASAGGAMAPGSQPFTPLRNTVTAAVDELPVAVVECQQTSATADAAERKRLWFAAIKPPMYSVGVNPVLVAASAVYAQQGVVPGWRVFGLVIAAICVIAWLNLSNDGFDANTGVDLTKPESVVNMTGGKRGLVLTLAFAFLAVGLGLLSHLLAATGDPRVAQWLGAAIACGYIYQGPPFRLSYKGLGEPLCFVAFGLLATPAFFLALQPALTATMPPAAVLVPLGSGAVTASAAAAAAAAAGVAAAGTAAGTAVSVASTALHPAVPLEVYVLAVLVGITTTVILFCSHFHQVAGDTAAGKHSPLVKLGTLRGCQVLRAAVVSPYVVATLATTAGVLPSALLLASLFSLPTAVALVRYAEANHTIPAAIAPLKKFAIKWHLAFDLALIVGLVGARILTGATL